MPPYGRPFVRQRNRNAPSQARRQAREEVAERRAEHEEDERDWLATTDEYMRCVEGCCA